jgi:hypothetical protein
VCLQGRHQAAHTRGLYYCGTVQRSKSMVPNARAAVELAEPLSPATAAKLHNPLTVRAQCGPRRSNVCAMRIKHDKHLPVHKA